MDTFVKVVVDLATMLLPAAISLGIIGAVVGLAMSVIGYRHGSDVMRTSVIGMVLVLAVKVIGAWFQSKIGGTGSSG